MFGYTDSVDKVIHEAAKTYAGISSEVLRHETREWFMEEVATRMRPKAAAVLAFHREQGERRAGPQRRSLRCGLGSSSRLQIWIGLREQRR